MRDRIASGSHASTRDGRAGSAEAAARLKQRWPCREQQVEQLVQVLCSSGSAQAPLFVFGPPATGKTAVVRCAVLGVWRAALAGQAGRLIVRKRGDRRRRPNACAKQGNHCNHLPRSHHPGTCCGSWPCSMPTSTARRPAGPSLSSAPFCTSSRYVRVAAIQHSRRHARMQAPVHTPGRRWRCTELPAPTLQGTKRRRDEGYDCSVKCDGTPDFLRALPGAPCGTALL